MVLIKYGDKVNVVYRNGVRQLISRPLLTTLLEAGQIASFERSGGWAHVGIDPIRKTTKTDYHGIERRRKLNGSAGVTSLRPDE